MKEEFNKSDKTEAVEIFFKHGVNSGYFLEDGWAFKCMKQHLQELKDKVEKGENMLENYTDEELEKELEKRKMKEEEKPKPIIDKNFTNLINLCEEYIDSLDKGEHLKDIKQWIFKASIEANYGKDVWKWINKHS